MFRSVIVIGASLAGLLLDPGSTGAQSKFEPGDKIEGVLKDKKNYTWKNSSMGVSGYATELPITLKASQEITFSVTLTGTERRVSIGLLDSTGKMIEATPPHEAIKTVQLKVKETPADDDYKIVVISDTIGKYSLQASGSSGEKLDEAAIKKKIKQHEEEIEKLKKLLKDSQDKSTSKSK